MNEDQFTIISSRKCGKKHISYNTILGLENEFVQCGCSLIEFNDIVYFYNKLFRKLNINKRIIDKRIIQKLKNKKQKVFYAAMVFDDLLDVKETLKEISDKLIIYIFDCWQPQWKNYDLVLEEINPWAVCFAYKKTVEYFSGKFRRCWFIPQSMDVQYFHEYNEKKERIFMQMGRKTEALHEMILEYMEANNIENSLQNYVYEKEKGKIIFKDTKKLAKEISKTLFFVCAPQCLSNPQNTGDISEVTARFYEAMACKSLIIGFKPEDSFDELFPYKEAMIEVNSENFSEIISELIKDKEKYRRIVEQNYNYVMEHHRWKNRLEELLLKITDTIE